MQHIINIFQSGWCADAVGARLMFRNRRFTKKEVIDAMHFIGEKTNDINDGQFTDDSEMEIALLTALLEGKNDPFFPVERIAKEYVKWYNSEPFDIGQTTCLALSDAYNADDMVNNAYEYNEESESNGSLMRCIPIAVFSLYKPYETILEIAEIDASLTHYSSIVKLTTGIYCCIISKILSTRISNNNIDSTTINSLLNDVNILCNKNAIIYDWYNEGISISNLKTYDAITNEGHVKHAFIMVIYFLKNILDYNYVTAIIEVLECGGDTDTNAKIIGNLFGACYDNCVPPYILKPVLEFDCTKSPNPYFKRPKCYKSSEALSLLNHISLEEIL